MTEFKFGDYVYIEQKRFGCENEFYRYKVVSGHLSSNRSRPVPVNWDKIEQEHEIQPVVLAICCGVDETRVEKFRASDVIQSNEYWDAVAPSKPKVS